MSKAKPPESQPENGTPDVPESLRAQTKTATVLRQKIWRPANVKNDWSVFVIVGREGSGKSLSCVSILKAVDPSFTADRVHFDAVEFLEQIESSETGTGDAVMLDESGVSLGNRTWYDRGQIEFNQAMQTARDDNMIVGLTLPRLEELDIQFQGRLHGFLEMTKLKRDEWAEFKYKNVDPSRGGQNKLYKKYPRMRVNGRKRKITRLRIGPPSQELIDGYEEKKAEWKRGLYEDTVDKMKDERGDNDEPDRSPKEIAGEIVDEGRVEEYIGDNYGQKYVDRDLIAAEYGIGDRKSKKVKKLLLKETPEDVN